MFAFTDHLLHMGASNAASFANSLPYLHRKSKGKGGGHKDTLFNTCEGERALSLALSLTLSLALSLVHLKGREQGGGLRHTFCRRDKKENYAGNDNQSTHESRQRSHKSGKI
jgi:hypothetical protein